MPGRAKSNTLKSRVSSAAKELLILEAVRLYEAALDPSFGESLGYRTAAKRVELENHQKTNKWITVNHNTVRNRHLQRTKSSCDAHFATTFMTRDEEDELVTYALEVAKRGFPLTHRRLQECAEKIICNSNPDFEGVGVNWTDRFLERHYDSLHVYWSRSLESARGKAVNPALVEEFYDLLDAEYEKHDFLEEHVYGADESGMTTGVAQKERVIGGVGKKTQHQKREVNRENTTVIVTICADGTTIPPITIFKGKHYQLRWAQNNPLNAS